MQSIDPEADWKCFRLMKSCSRVCSGQVVVDSFVGTSIPLFNAFSVYPAARACDLAGHLMGARNVYFFFSMLPDDGLGLRVLV